MNPYTIQDLGSLPGGKSCSPSAINSAGHVVGVADSGSNWSQAFLWTHATGIQALAGLPGSTHSWANDINDKGEIVGGCSIWDPVQSINVAYATHWVAGVPNKLDQGDGATANSINNKGEIAGTKSNYACSWKGGVIKLLDLASYHGSQQYVDCSGLSIIESGEVFGIASHDRPNPPPYNVYESALIWNNAGKVNDLDYPDNLDTIEMSGRDSNVLSANAPGFAVGSIFYGTTLANEVFKPFYWGPFGKGLLGTTTPLQMGTANYINAIGQIVGYLDDGSGQRATLWNGPVITDLNDLISPLSAWVLTYPTGMNEAGQIVGSGFFLGNSRGWIMSPYLKVITLPPIYWQIMFGFLGDSGGIQLVGPGGGGPGPGEDTLSSVLHHIPEVLRADIRNILQSQKSVEVKGFRRK
jgi:probable HAF family extracellular repeat protein